MLEELYYEVDEFCKLFEKKIDKISFPPRKRKRIRRMEKSEIMTILIVFHKSRIKTLKDFFFICVKGLYSKEFPELVSYNRFLELAQECSMHLYVFLQMNLAKSTGISYIDSTALRVCKNQRIYSHKTFSRIASRGKTSVGWFYGFKLHMVINENGEIIDFTITPGNISDGNINVVSKITRKIFGKLFGDKGYLSKKLSNNLAAKGIILFTRIRKNMKNKLISLQDKFLLRKRGLIETVIGKLKTACNIEHSRHRSVSGFFNNLISGMISYTLFEKKPSFKTKSAFLAISS